MTFRDLSDGSSGKSDFSGLIKPSLDILNNFIVLSPAFFFFYVLAVLRELLDLRARTVLIAYYVYYELVAST